jgi:hypothetical protein
LRYRTRIQLGHTFKEIGNLASGTLENEKFHFVPSWVENPSKEYKRS